MLCFSRNQGKIVYRLVGLPPAPTYFRVDSDSGSVFVRSDLKQDRGLQYNVGQTLIFHND